MSGSRSNRCGYIWPPDHQTGDDPNNQSCCWRQALTDSDRCAWHADPNETDEKTVAALQETRPDTDIIEGTNPVGELLDGAILERIRVDDSIPLTRVSLREADFTEAYLIGTNLIGTDLRRATLNDADLPGADLSDANLEGADLSNTYLREGDLSSTNLRKADLTNANLSGVDLTNADLDGTNLANAKIFVANLSGAKLREADLTNANLREADFNDAHLFEADLSDADLFKADFTDANLKEANLIGANLEEADLTDANLEGADLTDTNLEEADLSGANLSKTKLTDTEFLNATFREAVLPTGESLRTADLTGANLEGQDLRQKNLSGAVLKKANLTDVDLSETNLSEANLERALLNRADLFDTTFAGARLDGTVFGDVHINKGTFERLAPESSSVTESRSVGGYLLDLIKGPSGSDTYRCIYDPESQFDLSASAAQDAEIDPSTEPVDGGGKQEEDPPEVRAGGVYRQFERLAGDNALPEWQRRFFILRQDMQTRQKTGFDYLFAVIQRSLFGYGERFGRVISWSVAIIGLFSLVYLAGGWIRPVTPDGSLGRPISWTQLPDDPTVIWESVYYSTLTFTALGFGDFRPVGELGQLFTIMETSSGALLLALLVFVLGRRAAR